MGAYDRIYVIESNVKLKSKYEKEITNHTNRSISRSWCFFLLFRQRHLF